jgi:uncharacterized protein
MKIAIIGGSGMVGSAVCAELARRELNITAIARHPERIPAEIRCTRVQADVLDMNGLGAAISGHDVVVSAYAPGKAMGPQVYKDIVEAGWKIKRVFREVGGGYLINIGGASSLWGPRGTQMFEDPLWPSWYFSAASPEHLKYLHGMTGAPLFEELAEARAKILVDPRLDPMSDWPLEQHRQFIAKIAQNHDKGEAGRAQLELFLHDASIQWSFASPPWFMRPGPNTGRYRTTVRTLPMDGNVPAGISVADFALAVADEVLHRAFVHQHWSAARV